MKRNLTNWKEKLWEKGRLQRYLSLFLVAVLVTTQCTQSKGVSLVTAQSTCTEHADHDDKCGYVKAVTGVDCDHECDENCTGEKQNCIHTEHDTDCGYQPAVQGTPCTHSCDDETCNYEPAVEAVACDHEHTDSCEYDAETKSCNHVCGEDGCSYQEGSDGVACDHQHEETVCGYTEGTPEVSCNHICGEECYETITECQHDCTDGTCSYVEAVEGKDCQHTCVVCNPSGELSLTEATFDKNAESENYKDIVITFEKGADKLIGVEREVEAIEKEAEKTEEITEIEDEGNTSRETVVYDLSEDGQTVTLHKETLEQFEDGEYELYFVMESGEEKTLTLTVTTAEKIEKTVKATAMLAEVSEGGSVVIDGTTFPDPKFREYVEEKIDDGDGILTIAEQEAVTHIDLCGAGATSFYNHSGCRNECESLKGIEYFVNLKGLHCENGKLTELDVSMLSKLVFLSCHNNISLNEIDVSASKDLDCLSCSNSGVTKLTFDGQTKLSYLGCSENNIEIIDLSTSRTPGEFYCTNSGLKTLTMPTNSSNPGYLHIDGNHLSELEVSATAGSAAFGAGKQTLGTLAMYKQADGTWKNEAKQETDLVRTFNKETDFYSDSAMTDESKLDFKVNDQKILTAKTLVPIIKPVYYKTKLANGKYLSGSFTYSTAGSAVTAANGIIDWHLADALEDEKELVEKNYITVSGLADGVDYEVQCENFDKVMEGEIGTYEVVITSNGYFYETTLEVVVDIDYKDTEGNYLNFPDEKFQEYIIANVEGAADGLLTFSDLEKVTIINVSGTAKVPHEYKSLGGIEYFFNLEKLSATKGNGNLTSIDVRQNSKLYRLDLTDNENLSVIRIENNTALKHLYCDNTAVEELEISKLENLEDLACGGTNIKSLDIRNNTKLQTLYIWENDNFEEFDVSGLTELEEFSVRDCTNLKEINITGCGSLKLLNAWNTAITELDLSGFTNLKTANLYDGKLHTLNLNGCKSLVTLACTGNPLTSIDISGTALTSFEWENGQLTSLKAADCTSLTTLKCSGNHITNMDISGSTALSDFAADNQTLGELPMYCETVDGTAVYVNEAKNSADNVPVFMTDTAFKESLDATENLNGHTLSAQNTLQVTADDLKSGQTLCFQNTLADGKLLTGTFTYNVPLKSVSDGYMDKNDAFADMTEADLLEYFTITSNTWSTAQYEVNCDNFEAVQAGTLGDYNVTIKDLRDENQTVYSTVLHVGLDVYDTRNFPDALFRNCLSIQAIDQNKDGFLTLTELNSVTEINIKGTSSTNKSQCSSLQGIEYFKNLETLNINYTTITEFDISQNKSLKYLNCNTNLLTELDVSQNTELVELQCAVNELVELDVSNCTSITLLWCFENNLKSLTLGENAAMTEVDCGKNALTSLDASGLTNIETLKCYTNRISELKLPIDGNKLNSLNANTNCLSALDISNFSFSTFMINNQDAGTIELYQDENGQWTNASVEASETIRKFATTMYFYDDAGLADADIIENFGVDIETQFLSFENDAVVPMINPVYYKGIVIDAKKTCWPIKGSFSYNLSGVLETSPVYLDVNDVKALTVENDLAKYFTMTGTETGTPTATCADFAAVRAGTPGEYAVTLAVGDYLCTSTVIVGVEINATNFPSSELQNILSTYYDAGEDKAGFLTAEELNAITLIDMCTEIHRIPTLDKNHGCGQKSTYTTVKGIEYFPNLQYLYCRNAELTELDISKNTELIRLDCSRNNLSTLDVSKNTKLRELLCYRNPLTDLDVSSLSSLERLSCQLSSLTSIDVSKNINLKYFYCFGNDITSLDVSKNTNLEDLQCCDSKLTSLNVSNCTKLEQLWCYNSKLTTLDVSSNISLQDLRCYDNQLTSLDVSNLDDLTTLDCSGNKLTTLNLSNHESLTTFECASNKLESLNASGLQNLTYLDCSDNNMKTLDVTGCESLKTLLCNDNTLTSVDLTGITLDSFDGEGQEIATIALYYQAVNETSGKWVNEDRADQYVYSPFNPNVFETKFYDKAAPTTELSNLFVDSQTALLYTTTNTPSAGAVYFESDYDETTEWTLSGTFSYIIPSLTIPTAYMDVSFVDDIEEKTDLLSYFEVSGNSADSTGEIAAEDLDITVKTADWDNIQKGVTGTYTVTLKYEDVSADAVLELGVAINTANFPDDAFRAVVAQYNTTDEKIKIGDTEYDFLTGTELKAVDFINLGGTSAANMHQCKNVRGIKYFTNLEYLYAIWGSLTELDLRENYLLKYLRCAHNYSLETLDLRANKELYYVLCNDCNLKELYVSGLSNLNTLHCDDSFSTNGDTNNSRNEITSLDLSGCTSLVNLKCKQNQISYLDVSDCVELKELQIQENTDLSNLDVSNNIKLARLECQNNAITTLELGNNTSLTYLNCSTNQITDLDSSIVNCTKLENLYCSKNYITELNLMNHKALKELECCNCRLTSLQVSGLELLERLWCYNYGPDCAYAYNMIESLNVSGCSSLKYLECYDGSGKKNMKNLDIRGCTSLEILSCHINSLTSLDLSTNPNLITLNCRSNNLTELDLINNPLLKTLYCRMNKLTELDLSKNKELTYLECQGNQLTSLNVDGLDLSKFTTFNASEQAVGALPLYYNDSIWVNESKNSTEREAVFASGTTFDNENVQLNESGNITAATLDGLTGKTINFNKVLYEDATDSSKNKTISGTFTVTQPAIAVSTGYIDKNVAKNADDATLLSAFTVTDNSGAEGTAGTQITSGLSIEFTSEEAKTNAKNEVLGQYPVTITYDSKSYNTVLEVGLDIDYYTTSIDDGGVEKKTYVNFPDSNFRTYLKAETTGFDYEEGGKGFFTLAELEAVEEIKISGTGGDWAQKHSYKDLTGIKYFANLKKLSATYGRYLSTVDVSGMVKLESLGAASANVKNLNVTGCTALKTINVIYNSGIQIDGLSTCENLEKLTVYSCNLTSLDLSGNKKLNQLDCYSNPNLTSLDLSENVALEVLVAHDTGLTKLDLSNNTKLRVAACNNCDISSLDVSNNTLLEKIECNGNRLTSLNVSHLKNLTTLEVADQQVGTLGMYHKNGVWVNALMGGTDSSGAAYSSGKFVEGTLLTKNGNALGEDYFLDAGVFTVTKADTQSMSGISFESDLTDGNGTIWENAMTGTFAYEIPDIAVTNAYVDVNEVGDTTDEEILLGSFTVMTGNQSENPDAVSTSALSITFEDQDSLNNIREKVPGKYPVTLTYTPDESTESHTYRVALELGVEIGYTTDNGATYINFPNEGFRTHVANSYDTGLDKEGFLTAKELNAVTTMNLGGASGALHDCGNVEGIDYFANVTTLNAQYGALTSLDVSGLEKLTTLNCSENEGLLITSGDATGTMNVTWATGNSDNTVLTDLNCDGIGITALDVSTLPNLTKLSCVSNDLSTLDVSENTALQELKCSYNEDLNTLNLADNTALTLLYCSGCSLNELDLTTNTALTELACEYNQLKSLDVSHLSALTSLDCGGNELTSLNIDDLSNLVSVTASDQSVEQSLKMEHDGKLWYSTAKLDETKADSPFRTFNTSLTYFYAYEENTAGEELDGFAVNSDGILTIEDLEKGTGTAYFETNLNNSRGWSLNGTFSYETDYQLRVNNVFYTSQEMAEEEMTSEADMKGLPKLLTIVPQLDSFKELVQVRLATTDDGSELDISENNTFENLKSGTEGIYTYKATMDNLTGYGYMKVVPTGAAIAADRASYLYAESFYMGLSAVQTLTNETVLEKAEPIYQKYAGGVLQTDDEINSKITVNAEELAAIKTATGEAVGEAKSYPLTLTYQAGTAEALEIIVTVNVLNDLPQYLIEIPEDIALTREGNADYAEATKSIRLLTGADQILTDSGETVKVLADGSFYLYNDEEAKKEGLLVNVYKVDAENNSEKYSGGETPLAMLNPQTTEQTFKLISGSVKNLKYKNYTGSMNFTISYGGSN